MKLGKKAVPINHESQFGSLGPFVLIRYSMENVKHCKMDSIASKGGFDS